MSDLGYFDLTYFFYLEGVEAFMCTKLPLTVNLIPGNSCPLEKVLKNTSGNKIDIEVFAGKFRHKCRLVAVSVDRQTTGKQRRSRRRNRQKKAR